MTLNPSIGMPRELNVIVGDEADEKPEGAGGVEVELDLKTVSIEVPVLVSELTAP
jgi:hypothetical protein